MEKSTDLLLAELLCTRLCHDLTGPIGAVNNGAEFLEDDSFGMQEEAFGLIVSSAREAVNRMQYYRRAYGRVNAGGEASLEELKALSEAFFENSSVKLDWPDNHTDSHTMSVSRRMARLIMNMLIFMSGTLIRGGKLSVRLTHYADGSHDAVILSAEGKDVRVDPELEAALKGAIEVEALTPKNIQPYCMWRMADELKTRFDIENTATEATLAVVRL